MTEKRFKIIDKQFISYYGGNAYLISNGNCKFWLWHNESESQKVCDKLNIIMEENEQLKKENKKLHSKIFEMRTNEALERTEISKQSYNGYKTEKEFLKELEKW